MKALIFAITLAATLHAQEAWLYTPDRKVAEDFVAKLDSVCGYPNPATRTLTSVDIQEIVRTRTNRFGAAVSITNYVVLVPSVYAPKLRTYLDALTTLPEAKRVALTSEAAATNELGRVSGTNSYVLVTREVVESVERERTNAVTELTRTK